MAGVEKRKQDKGVTKEWSMKVEVDPDRRTRNDEREAKS